MDLALLKTSAELKSLSVHRLIQGEFRAYLTVEERRQRFNDAVAILREAFPNRRKGFTLFKHWVLCESLIEHVQVLCDRYREINEDGKLEYVEDFVYLISDSARSAVHFLGSLQPFE